jgi:RNA polymerase sigma factor (sigma-70 family)
MQTNDAVVRLESVDHDLETPAVDAVDARAETLDELFREHADALIRLGYLLTGSESVGEDLVQDVFARLARRGEVVTQPAAYLRRSVVNAANSWHRRRRLELRHARAEVPQHVSLDARELADALRVLTTRERAVVVLHYYEGRSIDEVAEILQCPRGTAASLQSRALAKLRKVIER